VTDAAPATSGLAAPRTPLAVGAASRSRGQLRRYADRNRLAVLGAVVLLAATLFAALAPWLPLADPDTVATARRLQLPLTPGHPLGTDEFGRDLLARLVWGARVSLVAGVATAAGSLAIGLVFGVFAGYRGGWAETILMRLTDVMMAFPYILLAIAIVAGLGPGLRNAMIAVAVVGFPLYARLVRGLVLSLREREFVEAARALGGRDRRILVRHLLPHLISPVVVAFSLDVGAKILATAGLSFLGLGTQPPTADWGSMLATARQFVVLRPHVALLPGLSIFVVVLLLNLVVDALLDLLDPRTRQS